MKPFCLGLIAALLWVACKKDKDNMIIKGVVAGPFAGCGPNLWIITYGDSVGTNVQRITAVNLPQEFRKPGLSIFFEIESGLAPQLVCNTAIVPPPDPRYVTNVRLR